MHNPAPMATNEVMAEKLAAININGFSACSPPTMPVPRFVSVGAKQRHLAPNQLVGRANQRARERHLDRVSVADGVDRRTDRL
jgi:hypothetical protein